MMNARCCVLWMTTSLLLLQSSQSNFAAPTNIDGAILRRAKRGFVNLGGTGGQPQQNPFAGFGGFFGGGGSAPKKDPGIQLGPTRPGKLGGFGIFDPPSSTIPPPPPPFPTPPTPPPWLRTPPPWPVPALPPTSTPDPFDPLKRIFPSNPIFSGGGIFNPFPFFTTSTEPPPPPDTTTTAPKPGKKKKKPKPKKKKKPRRRHRHYHHYHRSRHHHHPPSSGSSGGHAEPEPVHQPVPLPQPLPQPLMPSIIIGGKSSLETVVELLTQLIDK